MRLKIKIDSRLIHYLLLILIVVLVIGSVFGAETITNLLQVKSDTLVSLKAKAQALVIEQSNLTIAKKEVTKYAPLEKIAQTIVPQNKDQAQAVREIVNLAQQNNITLTSIIFPVSTLGSTVSTGPAPAATATTAPTAISLSQLTPVLGIPRVYTLPIEVEDTIQTDAVSYTNFYAFLSQLEQNRLTSQVTGLSIQPLTSAGNLITFTLTINEYIKPL